MKLVLLSSVSSLADCTMSLSFVSGKGKWCPCVSILRKSLAVSVTVPSNPCHRLSTSCALAGRSVPFGARTLALSLWSVVLPRVVFLSARRTRGPDNNIPCISRFPVSWSSLSDSILLLFSIDRVLHPCFGSVGISLPESSAQFCTTILPPQRDESPPLP
jgi:hypothetical protein